MMKNRLRVNEVYLMLPVGIDCFYLLLRYPVEGKTTFLPLLF